MPQTDKWHSKLLRPSTLPPSTIDIQSPLSCEQRSQIGAMLDYAASKNPGMQLKFGSCFEDRLSTRPYDAAQYNAEFFDHEGIVKGNEFGISFDSDTIGGLSETYKDTTSTSASERAMLPSRAMQGSQGMPFLTQRGQARCT